MKAVDRFRKTGLKLTPQRMAILEYLDGSRDHPSAEGIYNVIKGKFPMISFATVYKTLETLKEKGYIKEITIDNERRHYDPDTGQHHHLICTKCKRIVDIHHDFALEVPESQKDSYDVTGSHIEFYGICPGCREEMSAPVDNISGRKERTDVATFTCEHCGESKEGRCRPKKCPGCGKTGTMTRKESCG